MREKIRRNLLNRNATDNTANQEGVDDEEITESGLNNFQKKQLKNKNKNKQEEITPGAGGTLNQHFALYEAEINNLLGPTESKIKRQMNKKLRKKFKQQKKQEKKEDTGEQAKDGVVFDYLKDFSSSDYESCSDEEELDLYKNKMIGGEFNTPGAPRMGRSVTQGGSYSTPTFVNESMKQHYMQLMENMRRFEKRLVLAKEKPF